MKNYLIICLCVIAGFNGFAQNNFGAFAGVNYSFFTDGFAGKIYAEESLGAHFGVLYNLQLKEKISFRPKLSYSQQGDRTETKPYASSFVRLNEIDKELSYLNIAADFKFWNKIYVIAGPQLGILINEQYSDFGPVQSSTDLGLNLGGGFTIGNAFVELGAYQGLKTLLQYRSETGNTVDVRNALVKFIVGYNFN